MTLDRPVPRGSEESARADGGYRLASRWPIVETWRWPVSPALLPAVVVGLVLLIVVARTTWFMFGDERAYWAAAERLAAGQPLYDLSAPIQQAFAYWYPPILAQILVPFTYVAPDWLFTAIWTVLLLGCLWYLSGRNIWIALALVAFLPVALELRVRNVHLLIAALAVLALRRSWVFWIPATAVKLAPVLGIVYLLAAGRRREALLATLLGAAIVGLSYVLAPGTWSQFLQMATSRAVADAGPLPVPYVLRLGLGTVIAILAGRRGGRVGEVSLIIALMVANPTLWWNAFSLLVAVVPLWRTGADAVGSSMPDASPAPRRVWRYLRKTRKGEAIASLVDGGQRVTDR